MRSGVTPGKDSHPCKAARVSWLTQNMQRRKKSQTSLLYNHQAACSLNSCKILFSDFSKPQLFRFWELLPTFSHILCHHVKQTLVPTDSSKKTPLILKILQEFASTTITGSHSPHIYYSVCSDHFRSLSIFLSSDTRSVTSPWSLSTQT